MKRKIRSVVSVLILVAAVPFCVLHSTPKFAVATSVALRSHGRFDRAFHVKLLPTSFPPPALAKQEPEKGRFYLCWDSRKLGPVYNVPEYRVDRVGFLYFAKYLTNVL